MATPGRRVRDQLIPWAVAVCFFGIIGLGAIAFSNTARIERQEQGADYRICERAERIKANVHRHYEIGSRDRAFLERRLPIVDCRPNLESKPAAPMSVEKMRAYVDRFTNGELRPLPETPRRR